jgi:glutathione S-transferase
MAEPEHKALLERFSAQLRKLETRNQELSQAMEGMSEAERAQCAQALDDVAPLRTQVAERLQTMANADPSTVAALRAGTEEALKELEAALKVAAQECGGA